jgi:hypothetical protein
MSAEGRARIIVGTAANGLLRSRPGRATEPTAFVFAKQRCNGASLNRTVPLRGVDAGRQNG